MYNQYNLEASSFNNIILPFKSSLYAEKISDGSVRSYLSDVRHFLGWIILFLKSNRIIAQDYNFTEENTIHLLHFINQKILDAYKTYLSDNNIPAKTINRRFSSLRKFGSFCQNQKWVSENSFNSLRNISQNIPFPEDQHHLSEFRTELWKKGSSKLTIKNYLNDIKQFLSWNKKNF